MSAPAQQQEQQQAGTQRDHDAGVRLACSAPALPACPILYQIRADVLIRESAAAASGAACSSGSGASGPQTGSESAASGSLADSSHIHGLPAGLTLDAVPDAWLRGLRARGVDVLYILGVWQTGAAGWQLSYEKLVAQGWSAEAAARDAVSSPFAITAFRVHAALGGNAALARLRLRANAAGLRVMIDFVPNHVARDHR